VAKLKAPLLSLGAAGAIGKAMVFFGWKGIDCVREYVIPSNPKSDPQMEQRGYLYAAVAAIHAAQALAAYPLNDADKQAYSLWGSCFPTPRTWFNQAVKDWLDRYVAGDEGAIFRSGGAVEGDEQINVTVFADKIDGAKITAGRFFWGTSKTALLHSAAAGIDAEAHSANLLITGATNNVKYFWQFRVDDGELCAHARSGIYHATPTSP